MIHGFVVPSQTQEYLPPPSQTLAAIVGKRAIALGDV